MSYKKLKDGRYLVSVRPNGVSGSYLRRVVDTRSQAVRLELELMSDKSTDLDRSSLSYLVQYWFDHFGVNLKDGRARKSKIDNIVSAIGDLKYSSFKPSHFVSYRTNRLDSGVSKNTCNHDLAYLKTVFNKLFKLSVISSNKLESVQPLKFDQIEFSYLSLYQIKRLLVSCRKSRNESLFPVVVLALSTGGRWSEVEKLRFTNLYNDSVRFVDTKSGKSRTVPIHKTIYTVLLSRISFNDGRIFANCYEAFSNALVRARISLPDGQRSHVLRHSFASHFIMGGGSIFDLQKLLGHSDPRVTMRYAHLAPDHLKDAIKINPISQIFS